jgi:hypothetical protein
VTTLQARTRRATRAGRLVAAAAGVGALYFVNPNATHVPLCPLHAMTGLWCPFCGSTRAGYALLHGDLATAVRDNTLLVVVLPVLLVIAARWVGGFERIPLLSRLPRSVRWAGVAVIVLFGVLRNLPLTAALAPPS